MSIFNIITSKISPHITFTWHPYDLSLLHPDTPITYKGDLLISQEFSEDTPRDYYCLLMQSILIRVNLKNSF